MWRLKTGRRRRKGRLAEHTNEGYACCSIRVVYLGVYSAPSVTFCEAQMKV